jgi:hypothetical protein
MTTQQAHKHHYVPQWYQRRFLLPGQNQFFYLDLNPETVVNGSVRYRRRELLRWGTARCFYRDDLYTLKLRNWTTDQIEARFFGAIDRRGQKSVEVFGAYDGYSDAVHKAFGDLPQFMDAQRFRTPRGLDRLSSLTAAKDRNQNLVLMQRLFQLHSTMWMEGVWEIARARNSATKFIISDEPVTFYNRRIYPTECANPGGIELDQVGTRTLFPLSMESCLIITHTQFVRNPRVNPNTQRENARAYQQTIKYLLDTQFGRELEEDEVLRINFILKKRATRYIAAAVESWLYPEARVSTQDWSKLDDDWFLLPHLYKVPFSNGIVVGYEDGTSYAADEYGRHPNNPSYQDKKRHSKEWETHLWARQEWAKKRVGKSVAHVEELGGRSAGGDKLMMNYLKGQGLWPPKET